LGVISKWEGVGKEQNLLWGISKRNRRERKRQKAW